MLFENSSSFFAFPLFLHNILHPVLCVLHTHETRKRHEVHPHNALRVFFVFQKMTVKCEIFSNSEDFLLKIDIK